jgi:hypothetical protein
MCNKIGMQKCGERGPYDLYLLLIELITTTQHHIFHCKKNLPIRPKTQKHSMLFEFHAFIAQSHSPTIWRSLQ